MNKKSKIIYSCIAVVLVAAIATVSWWYFGYAPEDSGVEVSDKKAESFFKATNINLTTNLEIKESKLEKTREIDAEITAESKNKANTFENAIIITDPYETSPLTAVAAFHTKQKVSVRVTVPGKVKKDDLVHTYEAANDHRVPILGLYPATVNKVKIELLDGNKVIESKEFDVETEDIRDDYKTLVKKTLDTKEGPDGINLVFGRSIKYPCGFDSQGNIRWFLKQTTDGHGLFTLSNGRIILLANNSFVATDYKYHVNQMYEMDYLGRMHTIYQIANAAHHEVTEVTPGGNLLVLSHSMNGHVEDLIVELDRNTGEVVNKVDFNEIIPDLYREGRVDYTHMNSIDYNHEKDEMMISCRNISTVFKFKYSTKELMWILADPQIYKGTEYEKYVLKSVNDSQWHYQQHCAQTIAKDLDNNPSTTDVLIYDNRSFQYQPKEWKNVANSDKTKSYVVYYAINEQERTVEQKKLFEGKWSDVTSNQQYFPDENILVSTHASIIEKDKNYGEIYEFDFDSGEMIGRFTLDRNFYRSYRVDFGYDSCNEPIDLNEPMLKGTIQPLVESSNTSVVPEYAAPSSLEFFIRDGMLYTKIPQKTVKEIELVGTKGTYNIELKYDKSLNIKAKTKAAVKRNLDPEKEENIANITICTPLDNLPKGSYKINLVYRGIYVSTEGEITIQ